MQIGYAGFNKLYGHGKATEMACMAHIRRKFVDIFEAQGSAIAGEAIKRIAQLYKIEKQVRGSPIRLLSRERHNRHALTAATGISLVRVFEGEL